MSSEKFDYEAMRDAIFARLEREKMSGLALDDLRDAMAHPLAGETVRELMPYEASSVKEGEPAPDFCLPYLPGFEAPGAAPGETFTLSEHFGERPVALVFGSYT